MCCCSPGESASDTSSSDGDQNGTNEGDSEAPDSKTGLGDDQTATNVIES